MFILKIHIVRKGDTLFEIAKNYGVNFEDIVKLNPQLSSPDMIMPGMKIKIPSETKQVKNSQKKVEKAKQPANKAVRIEQSKQQTNKEVRVEQTKQQEEREARTTERPMGKVMETEMIRKKEEMIPKKQAHAPRYPVTPIIQAPSIKQTSKQPIIEGRPKSPLPPLSVQNMAPSAGEHKENVTSQKVQTIQNECQAYPVSNCEPQQMMKYNMQMNHAPESFTRNGQEMHRQAYEPMMPCCCRCMQRQHYCPSFWQSNIFGEGFPMPRRMNMNPAPPMAYMNQQQNQPIRYRPLQMDHSQFTPPNKYSI